MIPGDTSQLVKVIREAMSSGIILRQGKATAVNSAAKTATIELGNNTIPDVKYIMAPTVNAEVWILENGPDYLIIGSPGSSGGGGGGESLSATRVINGITWEAFIDIGDIGAANYKLSRDGVEMGRIQIMPDGAVRSFGAGGAQQGAARGNLIVDNVLSAGSLGPWTALPLGTGWVGAALHRPPRYRKFGDVVEVEGEATRSSGTNTIVGNLPSGFRPLLSRRFPVVIDGAASVAHINTIGQITVAGTFGTTAIVTLSTIRFSTL